MEFGLELFRLKMKAEAELGRTGRYGAGARKRTRDGVGAELEKSTYGWDLKSWFMGEMAALGRPGRPEFKNDLGLRWTGT